MASNTGTLSLQDLQVATGLGTYSEEQIQQAIAAEVASVNAVVQDELTSLVEFTTDVRRAYGAGGVSVWNRGDEYARAQTQKGVGHGEVTFPFDKFIVATGWTEDFRRLAPPAKYAQAFDAVRRGYIQMLQTGIGAALFGAADYDWNDYMATRLTFNVKRLLNADGAPIPLGPYGAAFDPATHTHYLVTQNLTAADADTQVRTVVEHGAGADVRIHINQADTAQWRALPGFVSALPSIVTQATTVASIATPLDTTRLTNRLIGVLANGAQVWTKPWVYPGYSFAYDLADPERPLACREDLAGSSQLGLNGQVAAIPLTAQHYVARFGFGVNDRTNGAILYFAPGNGGVYVSPV